MKYTMTAHAKRRLYERFGVERLPDKRLTFVGKVSNNRKIWRVDGIYCVINKAKRKILTVLTKEIYEHETFW